VVTVISRFRVRNGLEEEVRKAFLNRPRLVEKALGFRGLDALTDAADPAVFLLLTQWTDEESFRAWHRSEAHHQSHESMPQGLKLDAACTSLTIANRIEDPAGVQTVSDAIADHPLALSQWLMESGDVFALLLAPDGAIRARNRAGRRIFPPDPAKNVGLSILDYLVCSDAEPLRRRLAGDPCDGTLRLNAADGQHSPITLEAALVACRGAALLLGTEERRHDESFQTELLKLTNDLSVMMREFARKNRELKLANETIAQLARTDALTGLANRRTLHEALQREIARARRLGEPLSVIIADLDHFKSINDEYGHMTGDQALAQAAAVFGSQLRPYDLAARYGGEEFVLLLPGASTEGAIAVAERVRKGIADIQLAGCPRRITASLGVASWIATETPEEFVGRADAALYRAKSAGRNRVEAAPGVCT
jgi:diguanylate cyclase (GGDEF)-like protein